MRLFLLVYLAVYGGMLGYSLRKIHVAFACGWRGADLLLSTGDLIDATDAALEPAMGVSCSSSSTSRG